MAISRKIIAALGGELTVTSQVNHGTTFIASVPAGPVGGSELLSGSGEAFVRPQTQSERPLGTALCGVRVLLVEDGVTNRKLISLVLEKSGARVWQAENGQRGVELASEQPFDLIIMDMQMPVMHGYTAATILRESGLTTPIVALTAHALREDEQKCKSAGCTDYLTKPVDIESLIQTVRGILDEGKQEPETVGQADRESGVATADDERLLSCALPIDDPEFYEIALEFVGRLHEELGEIRAAWEADDLDALIRLAHWLKGSAGTAGFSSFTEPAATLERLARESRRDELPAAIEHLSQLARRMSLDGIHAVAAQTDQPVTVCDG